MVDDGNLKLEVMRVEGPTRVVGRALSSHTLQELALLHIPGAHKVRCCGRSVLLAYRSWDGLPLSPLDPARQHRLLSSWLFVLVPIRQKTSTHRWSVNRQHS